VSIPVDKKISQLDPSDALVGTDVLPVVRTGFNTRKATMAQVATYAESTLGTMAVQDADDVAITGGTINGIAVADLGTILQVVVGTTTTAATNTNASYSDTNLSAAITLKLASSKILVWARHTFYIGSSGLLAADTGGSWQIVRGSTPIMSDLVAGQSVYSDRGTAYDPSLTGVWSGMADDVPGAGTHTYKTQHRSIVNGQGRYVTSNVSDSPAKMILMEVAV